LLKVFARSCRVLGGFVLSTAVRGQRSKVHPSSKYRRLGVRVLLFSAKNLIVVAAIASGYQISIEQNPGIRLPSNKKALST
jgi:hypothetical protein